MGRRQLAAFSGFTRGLARGRGARRVGARRVARRRPGCRADAARRDYVGAPTPRLRPTRPASSQRSSSSTSPAIARRDRDVGSASSSTRRYRDAGDDIDLDRSLDVLVGGAPPVTSTSLWSGAGTGRSTAWCLLVDRSGSMHGRPLATAALAAGGDRAAGRPRRVRGAVVRPRGGGGEGDLGSPPGRRRRSTACSRCAGTARPMSRQRSMRRPRRARAALVAVASPDGAAVRLPGDRAGRRRSAQRPRSTTSASSPLPATPPTHERLAAAVGRQWSPPTTARRPSSPRCRRCWNVSDA